ncbi:MAG: DUF6747 family protein [Cellulophaga sp.]
MARFLHLKNIYLEAFEDCKPKYLANFLKVYMIFCVLMLTLALYAFTYRAVTGYHF